MRQRIDCPALDAHGEAAAKSGLGAYCADAVAHDEKAHVATGDDGKGELSASGEALVW